MLQYLVVDLSGVQNALSALLCFFFFQAEDGIRDVAVTGVQTCALPIFLFIGFVFIAVVVTIDLVAAIVVLAVLAAATAFATVLVAPAPSAMRLAAYFAVGLQGFVVAALLIARQGGASLAIGLIAPTAISPGAILAATAGAALFAGLYPFVPWRYERARATAAEREPLRGLLAMPAGLAASLILPRVLRAADINLSTLCFSSTHFAPP